MSPYLPRPARANTIIVARTTRRTKKAALEIMQEEMKRPKAAKAFSAMDDASAPLVLAAATSSRD